MESLRINGKPRQHTLQNLGTLTIPKEQHKTLANLIEANLSGVHIQSLFDKVDEHLPALARHFAEIIVQKRLAQAARSHDKDNHAPWDIPYGWKGLIRTMSSQTRVTTSFNCKDGTRMDIRTTLEPNAQQLALCRRLNVNPRPLKKVIQN